MMSTEKRKRLFWWVAIIFSFVTIYSVNGFLMVASFSAMSTYPADKAYWEQVIYSIGAIVSFLTTLVSLIAIRKLRNQK